MKMLKCPKCGFMIDADDMMGPKNCPKLLSNEQRKKLGMPVTKVPPHLAELGMKESSNLGGICNTKLKPLDGDELDNAGVEAIIHLQGMVKKAETKETALRGWKGLSEHEKKQTLLAYVTMAPEARR